MICEPHRLQGISDIITIPGLINVDFADVKAIMSNAGTAMLGVGAASGPDRAEQAALAATMAPLIQRSIERATGGSAWGGAWMRAGAAPGPLSRPKVSLHGGAWRRMEVHVDAGCLSTSVQPSSFQAASDLAAMYQLSCRWRLDPS